MKVLPFAPNPDSAESQTLNKKLHDRDTPVDPRQADAQTKSKQNTHEGPPDGIINPYSHYYQPNATIWDHYLKQSEAEDKALTELLQVAPDQLLLFAGLLGAIVTAFLIEARQDLTADPATINDSPTSYKKFEPTTTAWLVNAAWYSSLVLTLISALTAVLARGWLAKYRPVRHGPHYNDACERYLRYLRAKQWRLGLIVGGIPFLIQVALFLFAVGLVILAATDNLGIGIILSVLTITATTLYYFSAFLLWFSPGCPFQTSLSDFIPGLATNTRYDDDFTPRISALTCDPAMNTRHWNVASEQIDPTAPKTLFLWDRAKDFLKKTRGKPEPLEAEAHILAQILVTNTDEKICEEAVKAVAGVNPNQYLQDVLESYNATRILVRRFTKIVKVVPGLPITVRDVGQAEAYLYAMLRIVGSFTEERQNKLTFMEEELLRLGQPLHQWEDYMDYLQPLACALRIKILVATGCDDHHSLQWEGSAKEMVTIGLPPYTRWILLSAMIEGLLKGKEHVRKMSALVLAKQLQIAEARTMLIKRNDADEVVVGMATILKESDDLNVLEGLVGIGRYTEFQNQYSTVMTQITRLINHEEWRIRVAGAEALLKLSEQAQLRRFIPDAIPDIIKLAKSQKEYVCKAGVDTLLKLSYHTELRPWIASATDIVELLRSGHRYGGQANAVSKLLEHVEFRPSITTAIPRILALLKDNDKIFRRVGIDAVSNLSDHAEFRLFIETAIPQIVKLLNDAHQSVRMMGANSLSKLAAHDEFRPLMRAAIPTIITLLRDSDDHIREAAADALLKLSEYSEFQPSIKAGFPNIIRLLSDRDDNIRMAGSDTLSKLSDRDGFRPLIEPAIHEIVLFLKDKHSPVRRAGADAVSKLSEHAEFRDLIRPIPGPMPNTIPDIVTFLKDRDKDVREAGINALSRLSGHAEFHPLIKPAIPGITSLLKDNHQSIRKAGIDALSKISEHAKFQPLIEPAIPVIIALLKDGDEGVRKAGADAVSKLLCQAEFRPSIESELPKFINLLKDNNARNTCIVGAEILSKLSKQAEHENKGIIGGAIFSAIRNTGSSNLFVDRLETKVNDLTKEISRDDGAGHLTSYWIGGDRFEIFNGVCVLAKLKDYAQMCDSQMLADFFTSDVLDKAARTYSELSVTLKLSQKDMASKFRSSIIVTVPDIINLLKDSDENIRIAATDAFLKLSEHAEFRPLIGTVIPSIINILDDSTGREAGVDTLSKLSKHIEFRPLIGKAIPQIINLLKDGDVQMAVTNTLLKLAEYTEFRDLMTTVAPNIVNLLKHGDDNFAWLAGTDALPKLSDYAEFQPSIGDAIPGIITLLNNSDEDVRVAGTDTLSKLSEQTEFQSLIGKAIPEIITLLNNSDEDIQKTGTDALSSLSAHAEFRPQIETAIPKFITLLKDSDVDVRMAATDALSKLSNYTEFQDSIGTAIPDILTLLKGSNKDHQKAGINALAKLSEHTEFRDSIMFAIPDIVNFLSDSSWGVREAGVDALSKLSDHVEFQPSIGTHIPTIINLLGDSDEDVQMAGINVLSKLSKHAKFRPSIVPAINGIITLLTAVDEDVRKESANALSTLSEYAEFQSLIGSTIPTIIKLLEDSDEDVQKAGANALSKLSELAKFQPLLMTAIPKIATLLIDSRTAVQETGAATLLKLSEQTQFRPLIANFLPQIIALLKDAHRSLRKAGADTLLKLSEQVEFQPSIKQAIPQIVSLLKTSNVYVQLAAAGLLSKFSDREYFADCHQYIFPAIIDNLLSLNTVIDTVPVCTHIFARHASNDYFRDKIVKVLMFAFDCVYFEGGARRTRGLSVIEVIADSYATKLGPILYEIWAIYSLTHNILPNVGLDHTKFLVEQMEIHGVLKAL